MEMAKRDLIMLNKGAFIGYAWLVLQPLILTLAYVLIVSFILGSRLNSDSGVFDYGLYVLGGMIPWQIVTKMLADAPSQLYSRMELIKQVIYPIETLPLTSLLVISFGSFISLIIFILLGIFSTNLSMGILLFPIPFIFLAIFTIGMSWIFSIVGIFIKDLKEITTVILGLMVYATPVIASPELVGERVWALIMLNPLSHIVICFRDVYYLEFNLLSWLIFILMSLFSFVFGALVISKAKLHINQYI